MNILVTGSNGQLGNEIRKRVSEIGNGKPDHVVGEPNYYIFTDYEELDITDESAVADFVKENHISVVVNCAAYTNVEKAQKDRNTAYNVNAKGPMNLALALSKSGGVLIHISTDYVFGGMRNTPVPPIPVGCDPVNYPDIDRDDCYYGYSKNIGENFIQQSGVRYIIIRTSWLYSEYGKNFVKTMATRAAREQETRVVYDQTGSPTYAGDLAGLIMHIIEDNNSDTRYLSKTGVYNFSNKGAVSWYDLAHAIFDYYGMGDKIFPCRSSEYPSDVVRPAYSVLDTEKAEREFDYKIRYWRDTLYNGLLETISRVMREEEEARRNALESENTEYSFGHNVDNKEREE